MTTLAANSPRDFSVGDHNHIGVIASDIIYEGAAVGDNGAGYARPLSGGDKFLGFALEKADNSSGAAGDINVEVRRQGVIVLSVSGAVITDVGQPVYATDDDTFSFIKTSGSFVGLVKRFVESGKVEVEFGQGINDPWADFEAETVSDNKTLDEEDSGKVFFVDTDAKTVTLTAVAGMRFAIVNAGAFGTVLVTVSPDADDGIASSLGASTDDEDLLNTKATANRGDFVILAAGDATGWYVEKMRGTWAKEA
jgi:hypothetical protein